MSMSSDVNLEVVIFVVEPVYTSLMIFINSEGKPFIRRELMIISCGTDPKAFLKSRAVIIMLFFLL